MSTGREDFIQGLRALADALEQHQELDLPYQGTGTAITFHYLHTSDPVADMAAAMQAIPCDFTAEIVVYGEGKRENDAYLYLDGTLHGVRVQLAAYRKDTCRQDENGEWHIPDVLASRQPGDGTPSGTEEGGPA